MAQKRSSLRTLAVCALAVTLGGIVGFSTAGPALFADGGTGERVVVLAVSIGAYFVLGLGAGALESQSWKLVAVCLYAPLLAVLAFFGGEAFETVGFSLLLVAFALGDLAAALSGALLGSRLRTSRAARPRV